MSESRDESIERLLKQSGRVLADTGDDGACLDAETLAAWAEDGLTAAERAAAEAHLAQCARCQTMLAAFGRSAPTVPEPEPAWKRWSLGWLVPVAVGIAAVAIWIVVPQPRPAPAADAQKQAADSSAAEVPLDRERSQPAPATGIERTPPRAGRLTNDEQSANRDERQSEAAQEVTAPVAGALVVPQASADSAAPAAKAAEQLRAVAAAPTARSPEPAARDDRAAGRLVSAYMLVTSPDPQIRWRLVGSTVQYSGTGGQSWEDLPVGVSAELTAGASPSRSVCWIVGRAGTVLRTTDGRRFQRIPFPEPTDLAAVQSLDDSTAIVTTSGGRLFRTADGGLTWTPAPLQEF